MAILVIGETNSTDAWVRQFIAEFKKSLPNNLRVYPECGKHKDVEIALAWNPPLGALAKFPNLMLIISLAAGVEHLLRDPDLPQNIPIVRIVSPSQTLQMAEYVNLAVTFFRRRLLDYRQLQKAQRWEYLPIDNTQSFTVGIMGLGVLGSTVARRLRGNGFSVKGWSRSPKEIEGIECFSGEQFRIFLSRCRVLVCLLPLTSATENILNRETFSALPTGAYIVNVGRGKHLVDADLLSALDSGKIAGAFLDSLAPEPLPQNHRFWFHPKIIITPHIAAPGIPSDRVAQVIDIITKFKQGQPLKNLVNLQRGY